MKDTLRHILLDVGHANGTGAHGCGLDEHEVNTRLADLLRDRLRARGFAVSIVDFPTLSNREDLNRTVQAANSIMPDFLVSLHCDSADRIVGYDAEENPIYELDPRPHGAHVCYYSQKGLSMARCIASYLCPLLPGRGEQVSRRTGLAMLSRTHCPAVLVESGFLPNEGDATFLRKHLDRVADAICQGICNYFAAA